MRTLLRIDSSIRQQGSHSRDLTDHYQQRWQSLYPEGKVIVRDLALTPVPHLDSDVIQAFYDPEAENDQRLVLADCLLAELTEADDMVISSPLYNMSLPSSLKAYFDYVARPGKTFRMADGQYQGLLSGKSAALITTRGSLANPLFKDDFQCDYIRAVLKVMGITLAETIEVEGMSLPKPKRALRLSLAKANINYVFDQRLSRLSMQAA